MVATTDKLSGLHGRLADAMSEALDAEIKRIAFTETLYETDLSTCDEGTAKAISNAISLAPSARVDNGLLKTVSAFLKDNNITSDLDSGEAESETQRQLEAMHAKRRAVSLPTDLLN